EIMVGRPQMHDYFSTIVADSRRTDERWRDWHCEFELSMPAASDLNPSIPRPLSALVARMTAKRVDDRCRSINEVIEALTRILRDRRADGANRLARHAPGRGMDAAVPQSSGGAGSTGRLLTDGTGGLAAAYAPGADARGAFAARPRAIGAPGGTSALLRGLD